MHVHSKRWVEAQKVERFYWTKDRFRESEFKELAVKYSGVLSEIEGRYGFTDSTKILDLGCGATCPSTLFRKGEKFGVDPLVGTFLEKDVSGIEGKITLSRGSGESIPFREGFFDAVICRNALDHMDDVDLVMDEIRRVARPGGIIILSIYTYTPFIAALKKTSEYIPFLRNVEHPYTFTPGAFKGLASRHFEVLEERIIFEGKNSIDYGKLDVEMREPLLNRIFALANRYVFMNDWFVREYMLVCRTGGGNGASGGAR